ncbi:MULTISPECIES: hypothetical protein [Vibrio]|uniref:hypothetical protein n=1 Tax=Vibrio TaxID=662 RepID=UPI000B7852B2|nr:MULTISPECIES: hypothetical protein [Vibrio]MBS9810239.1 hypothetical protein [Vibrio alginolyticus]MCR9642256.1 hypothetical protein [Vibrio alginolyticus]MDW2099567.1 hypothetical protein [Vibrio sp. 1751]MDW2244488.1 hypothetical protein [Vibrio sp. 1287]OXD53195.1 hypothetical protein CA153_21310 [Vibrio parahaemolyticus]
MEERSLRSHVLDLIGSFLYQEKFPSYTYLREGILDLVDSTSSYREEGEELYPEIFITNNIDSVLETLPFCKNVEIDRQAASVKEFSNALKLCAPLSRNGWVIYINVEETHISYGVVSSEISELSPTFRTQAVGELSQNGDEYCIAYLQNVGNKTVLLKGSEASALICLTLNSKGSAHGHELKQLCSFITQDIDDQYKDISASYFKKLIGNALIIGHGNLIGVVKDNHEKISALKTRHSDGIYLRKPINMYDLLAASEEEKTREACTSNRLYSSLLESMLNHDGMTVLTTSGKILGYHVFVKPQGDEENGLVGGARTRAFEIMKRSECFECCFYKSQDGNEKIWSVSNA